MSLRWSTSLRRADLLGRHVRGRAHHRRRSPSGCRSSVVCWSFEIPKSSTFSRGDPSGRRGDEEVGGLEIAMNDPDRAPRRAPRTPAASGRRAGRWSAAGAGSLTRSVPSRYSSTMYGAPVSSEPTSSTRATCSLLRRTTAWASRRKRCTTSGSGQDLRGAGASRPPAAGAGGGSPARRRPCRPVRGRARRGTCPLGRSRSESRRLRGPDGVGYSSAERRYLRRRRNALAPS